MPIRPGSRPCIRQRAPSEIVVSKLPVTSPCWNSKACTAGGPPNARATAVATPDRRIAGPRERLFMLYLLRLLLPYGSRRPRSRRRSCAGTRPFPCVPARDRGRRLGRRSARVLRASYALRPTPILIRKPPPFFQAAAPSTSGDLAL